MAENKNKLITFENLKAFKEGMEDFVEESLAKKQGSIENLEEVIAGATAGQTAVQPDDLAPVATSGSYQDLENKPTIPTNVSDLTNDAGYATTSEVETIVANLNPVSANVELAPNTETEPLSILKIGDDAYSVPTKISDLTDDSGFLAQAVAAQIYATKQGLQEELATKQDILEAGSNIIIKNNVISVASNFTINTVVLQTSDLNAILDPRPSTIYLVPKDNAESNSGNIYSEYMYIGNSWELIGSTEINLADYVKSTYAENTYFKKANISLDNEGNLSVDGTSVKYVLNSDFASFRNSVNNSLSNKQRTLTAGTGITINDNGYSATISADANIKLVVKNSLEDITTNEKNGQTIYLIRDVDSQSEGNYYKEYIWVNKSGVYGFEQIGSTEVNLSNYIKTADADERYILKSESLDTLLTEADDRYILKTDALNDLLDADALREMVDGAVVGQYTADCLRYEHFPKYTTYNDYLGGNYYSNIPKITIYNAAKDANEEITYTKNDIILVTPSMLSSFVSNKLVNYATKSYVDDKISVIDTPVNKVSNLTGSGTNGKIYLLETETRETSNYRKVSNITLSSQKTFGGITIYKDFIEKNGGEAGIAALFENDTADRTIQLMYDSGNELSILTLEHSVSAGRYSLYVYLNNDTKIAVWVYDEGSAAGEWKNISSTNIIENNSDHIKLDYRLGNNVKRQYTTTYEGIDYSSVEIFNVTKGFVYRQYTYDNSRGWVEVDTRPQTTATSADIAALFA